MEEQKPERQEITVHIRRFDPERDEKPYWKKFQVTVDRGMTVLEALHEIKEWQDQSLAYRFSCRMGICGSCAMLVNGVPMLACNTQVSMITERVLAIAPLPNFDIIKDLVPDLSPMFAKHRSVQPWIQRKDVEAKDSKGTFKQLPEEMERYLQFAYCIKCGACMAACPTLATDEEYLGPMPLAQAYRYSTDSRDEGFQNRKQVVGTHFGAFRCHYAGECSRVCPKGVDPGRAIQLMKRRLVLDYLRLRRTRRPAETIGPDPNAQRRPEIPAAPPFTVEQSAKKAAAASGCGCSCGCDKPPAR